MAPKRGRGRSPKRGRSPSPKRSKGEKNVASKVSIVRSALNSESVDVPGPETNREMLASMVSLAMGNGSASDERHAYQKITCSAVGEVLAGDIVKCKNTEAATNGAIVEADKEKDACKATLDDATGRLAAKKTQIAEAKETLEKDEEAVVAAKKALTAADAEVANFDDITKAKEVEREKYNEGLTVMFEALKKFEWADPKEKRKCMDKYSNAVCKLLEKCGADESLYYCLPAALTRKPEERGTFDLKAIQNAEKKLTSYLGELDQRLGKGPDLKTEKETEAVAAKTALESAEAKEKASEEALDQAETEKTALSEEVSTAKAALKKAQQNCAAKQRELTQNKAALAAAKEKQSAFKFLLERLSTETSSYYWQIKGVKYDRELLNLCLKCAEDEKIELSEAQAIIEKAKDGQGITAIEKQTIMYIMESGKCTVEPDAKEFLDNELKALSVLAEKATAQDDGKDADDDMGELIEKVSSSAEL